MNATVDRCTLFEALRADRVQLVWCPENICIVASGSSMASAQEFIAVDDHNHSKTAGFLLIWMHRRDPSMPSVHRTELCIRLSTARHWWPPSYSRCWTTETGPCRTLPSPVKENLPRGFPPDVPACRPFQQGPSKRRKNEWPYEHS